MNAEKRALLIVASRYRPVSLKVIKINEKTVYESKWSPDINCEA